MSGNKRREVGSVNGVLGPASDAMLPITDGGFLRGDAVFEVMKLYGGQPFTLAEHLDRMERSAAAMRLPLPRAQFEAEIQQVLHQRGPSDGLLRLVFTRGGSRVVMTEPPLDLPPTLALGFVTYEPNRVLNGVKSVSYGANWLATRLAQERGFDDALLVRENRTVLEAPTSALFWVRDGALETTPLSAGILASVTRAVISEVCAVKEVTCTAEDLLIADEVFLASVSREIHPVSQVETTRFGAPGPVTTEVRRRFHDAVRAELGHGVLVGM